MAISKLLHTTKSVKKRAKTSKSGSENVQKSTESRPVNVQFTLFRGNKCEKYTVFQGKVYKSLK